MADTSDSYRIIRKIQFHYWFSDKSHMMDALVHNKCERELLELTKVVAKICGVSIKMETEPSGKGGLKSWLSISAKLPKKTPAMKVALINTLVAASVATPSASSAQVVVDAWVNQLMSDKEMNDAPRVQLQQELSQLKEQATALIPRVDQNTIIKKRRSNFYDLLRKYEKVKNFSVTLTDDAKKSVTEEQLIARDTFPQFLITANTSVTEIIELAPIEIISPVLVKGHHKWKGMYLGSAISFAMKSSDFMELVQSGKIEFKSGSMIHCTLEIEKKMNGAGIERIKGYNILGVSSYSETGKTIETTEGKQKQKQNVISKRQLDLFG